MSNTPKPLGNSIEQLRANEGTRHGIFFTEWNPAIPFKCPEGCTQVKFRVRADEFVKVAMRFDDRTTKLCEVAFDRETNQYFPAHCIAANHTKALPVESIALSEHKRRIEELQTQVGVAYTNGQADARRDCEASLKSYELALIKARQDYFDLILKHDAQGRELFCAQVLMMKAKAPESLAVKEGRKSVGADFWREGGYTGSVPAPAPLVHPGVEFWPEKCPKEVAEKLSEIFRKAGLPEGAGVALPHGFTTDAVMREAEGKALAAARDRISELEKENNTLREDQRKVRLAEAWENSAYLQAKNRLQEVEKERDAFGLKAKQLAENLDRLERGIAETRGAFPFEAMKARFIEADASARFLRNTIGVNRFGQEHNCSVREDERQAKLKAEGYDPKAKAWVQPKEGGAS